MTLISSVVSGIGSIVGIGGVGAAATRLGRLGSSLKLLAAGIAAVARSPTAWAIGGAAALGYGLYNNLSKNDRRGRPDPWEVQRQRNRREVMAVKPGDFAKRDVTLGSPGGFRAADRTYPAGGFTGVGPLGQARMDGSLNALPSAKTTDDLTAPFLSAAEQTEAAGRAAMAGFGAGIDAEMSGIQARVDAFVAQLLRELNFTATPTIAPKVQGLGSSIRGIQADTGIGN